jgi:hypothetical protein
LNRYPILTALSFREVSQNGTELAQKVVFAFFLLTTLSGGEELCKESLEAFIARRVILDVSFYADLSVAPLPALGLVVPYLARVPFRMPQ